MINPFRNLSTFPTLMKTTKKLATYKQSTISVLVLQSCSKLQRTLCNGNP